MKIRKLRTKKVLLHGHQVDGEVEDLGGVRDDGLPAADALVEVQALGKDIVAGQITGTL
jgi:hypothetical protein